MVRSLRALTLLPAKTRDTPTLTGGEQKIYAQVEQSEPDLVLTPGKLEQVNELNWSTVLKTNAANLSPRELGRVKDLNWSKILTTNNRFEALSPDEDNSSEIHDDKTVKTSNCRTVQADQATPRASTSKRRANKRRRKKKQGRRRKAMDTVETDQGEQATATSSPVISPEVGAEPSMNVEPPVDAEPPMNEEPPMLSPELLFDASYAQREDKTLTEDEIDDYHLAVIFRQYSLKKGLKEFGDRGEEAVSAELNQFHNLNCFDPIDADTLTSDQWRKALALLMFLKQKRATPNEEGKVKARGCIVGTPQRKYIKKEDAASPTVTLESLFIIVSINAFEKRRTGAFDCPGAFLHTKSDEDVIIALEGPLAELMVKVDPKIYRKYTYYDEQKR